MSVEVRLIIGEAKNQLDKEGLWVRNVASVDLAAPDPESLLYNFDSSKYPRAFFYGDDGDTRQVTDCYGTKMFAIPIEEFVKIFKQECERWKNDNDGVLYRRFAWVLPLLTRMKNYQSEKDMSVIMYWH